METVSSSRATNFRASEKSCLPKIMAGTRSDRSKVPSRSILAISDASVDEALVKENLWPESAGFLFRSCLWAVLTLESRSYTSLWIDQSHIVGLPIVYGFCYRHGTY